MYIWQCAQIKCSAQTGIMCAMSASPQQFDFIVIGCGSGGSACADRALSYGAKVCLVERGCSPNPQPSSLNLQPRDFQRMFEHFCVNNLLQIHVCRWRQTRSRSWWNVRCPAARASTCCCELNGYHQPVFNCHTLFSPCRCVNVGCVPKKLMFEAAHVMERCYCCARPASALQPHSQSFACDNNSLQTMCVTPPPFLHIRIHGHSRTAPGFGINVGSVSFDWSCLKRARDQHTRGAYIELPPLNLTELPTTPPCRSFSHPRCRDQRRFPGLGHQ